MRDLAKDSARQAHLSQVKTVVDSYSRARSALVIAVPEVAALVDQVAMPLEVRFYDYTWGAAKMAEVAVDCEAALGYLQPPEKNLPKNITNKLESLRTEVESLEGFNPNLYKHLTKALDEYEETHFLAAGILSGKAFVFMLESLEGQHDSEKVERLVKLGLVKADMKQEYLKATKLARNYFTHDISAIPDSTESLRLLTDACNLALKLPLIQKP